MLQADAHLGVAQSTIPGSSHPFRSIGSSAELRLQLRLASSFHG